MISIKRDGGKPMKKISILGVPMDLGQTRRGVDMGPSAIRYAGVLNRLEKLDYDVEDIGDIAVKVDNREEENHTSLKNLKAIARISEEIALSIQNIIENKRFPLLFGGDHSIAIGTIAGISKYYQNLGVIWFDAHGDLNTEETSPSGNIHGMPLAASMGFGHPSLTGIGGYSPKVNPENVVIIGARDLDKGERELIKSKNIKVFTMHEIDRLGMTRVMEESIDFLKK